MVSKETIFYNFNQRWKDYYGKLARAKNSKTIHHLWVEHGPDLKSWWFDFVAAAKIEQELQSRGKMLFCLKRPRVSLYAALFRLGILKPVLPHLSRDEIAILALAGSIVKDIPLTDKEERKVLAVQKRTWKRRKQRWIRRLLYALQGGALFGVNYPRSR